MERVVDRVAPSLFEQANILAYKQSLKENTGEISTMLHTDFVSNFCLFFEHAFRLDTRRQKARVQPLLLPTGDGWGSVRAPSSAPNGTRGRARATQRHQRPPPKALPLHVVGDRAWPVSRSGLSAMRSRVVYHGLLFSARAIFSDV
jgi:hypothetical protein